MSVTTPNMNLVESTVNVDNGLAWENNLNASLSIIDSHNHAPGSGVQITPTGLNINTSLPFNNNLITGVQALVLTAQTTLSSLGAVYSKGVDLYFNDGNGNAIQITSGGSVNATSSGIASGSATASFVSSVLVVNAATNTPANIQGGSLLLGNNSAGSKFLTLSPPSAMAANYSLTLPNLPGAAAVLSLDTSGNFATGVANVIQTINITNAAVTRPKLVAVGQQISSSSGNFTTNATTLTAVTNLSVTITTTGRPICVFVSGDGTDGGTGFGNSFYATTGFGYVALLRGASVIMRQIVAGGTQMPGTTLYILDPQVAGTYTYSVQASNPSGNTTGANDLALYAYEL